MKHIRKITLLFFLLIGGYQTLLAQYTIGDSDAIPLNGSWSFAMDPRKIGAGKGWFNESFDTRRWDEVTVPHCFSSDLRYQFYTGTVWYKRSFPWRKQIGKRVILHFDAVYYASTIWLNNKKIGSHEGGYTPFTFDITDFLQSGKNTISISVDNDTWQTGSIPGAKDNGFANDPFMGWINYGGITRPVYLTVKPEVYLENLKIDAVPDLDKGTAKLIAKAFIRNASGKDTWVNPTVIVSYHDQSLKLSWNRQKKSIPASQSVVWQAETVIKASDVKLWSIDEPNLYQIKGIIPGDTISNHFGIRKVEVRNMQLLLNGEPVRMAGANRVVDYPGLGSLEPDWLIEKDFRLMKEAGMVFHRLTHYTPAEHFYELADQYGMLIIAEPGNWQLTPSQMENDTIRTKFKQQFTEMMQRDWNHPSVVAYSVGNEYMSDEPAGQRWTKDMIAFGRLMDPGRLFTFVSMRLNALPKKPEDEASQYSDFVCTNTYGNHVKVLDNIHRLYPDKPVLISEWGTRADEPSEDGQIKNIEEVVAEIRKRPYVMGASWWTFNDYQSRYEGTNPNGYRPWGLVSPDRIPKPAYKTYRKEMALLTLKKVGWQPGDNGRHRLILKVSARADFPSYNVKNYILKTIQGSQKIPELKPGTSVEIGIPVTGFDHTLSVQVVTPTGFAVSEQNFELTEEKSKN
ncbi:glycoside hydrolase family 2 protein [Mucilaginibacter sp. SP1R1]|uniref:glycoside hydrolase family 2 protein n=1 Tax=Mucilaginibacter sp. SP1R1 TaxID=2723091 RepID=UPI00161BEF6E|nr:glycoside hydrolase family 2 TIM barrel-domain containing protein [Mucilaginibacter sp. SP1R1]MBB6148141.1 beta-glucuronidase [Mucilaginibacter sp. SP1R1]